MDRTRATRVLFFNSAAGIWAHSASDSILLQRLSKSGAEVTLLSCDGYVEGLCAVRQSRGRSIESLRTNPRLDCSDCKFTSRLMAKPLGTNPASHSLGASLDTSDRADVRKFMTSWKRDGLPLEREFRGVPIARLGGYEVSLKYKSWDSATRGAGKDEYLAAVTDAALTVCATQNFLRSQDSFEVAIVRSPQYANNGSFSRVAKAHGLKVVFLDGSPNLTEDYTHLMLWDWSRYLSGNPAIDHFNLAQDLPRGEAQIRIERHFSALSRGTSHKVYSSGRRDAGEAFSRLGLNNFQPTALLGLSSNDESVSAQMAGVNPRIRYPGVVFKDQFEWVERTIKWFAQRPEYQLVIRIHPREFPNARESRISPAGLMWEAVLKDLPKNVFLNHPDHKISIYELFENVDVVVTGWSSVGLEAAAKNLKLITYDSSLPVYPASIGLTGITEEEYFSNLELALTGRDSITYRDNALKWLDLVMNVGTSRLGGRFLASKRNLLPRWVSLVLEGLDRYLFFIFRPLDLWRGLLFEPTDWKFRNVILEGKSSLYE